MQFSSYGIKRHVSRKTGRKDMAFQAESCELRTLLCASVFSEGAVDSPELPVDDNVDSLAGVAESDLDDVAAIDGAVFEIMPVDWPTNGPVDWQPDGPTDESVDWQPDGPGDERHLIAEEIWLDDAAPVDGWDPSWLYQTLTFPEADGSEEIVVDQGTGWEDGLGCGVSPDGFVPGDLAPNDFDGDGVPDESELYAFDPLPPEEYQDVLVEDYYSGGSYEEYYYGSPYEEFYSGGYYEGSYYGDAYFEPVDGEVAVEVDKPASDPNDEVVYLYGKVELQSASGEPVDVVEDGELLPIRTLESSDFDPAVIFYSAAAGGVELQRTNNNAGVHEEAVATSTVATSTLAIPVRPNASNSLFNADSGRSLAGIPVGLQTTSVVGINSGPAKRSTTQRRSSTQVAAAKPSVASEGLDSLTPLLGGETGSDESDSLENSASPEEVESGSVEEAVSESGNGSSVASGFAAKQNLPARNFRTAMIDRVMALYAENSFNS